MTKVQPDDGRNGQMRPASAATLSPSVRRHLGMNLRNLYATSLVEPVSERIETLLAKLGRIRTGISSLEERDDTRRSES
ncbi:hypothetical protein [Methylobacterium sp. 77]|uniref:hypothetical protein n=1 Tax=Methylobacterium sp. 77 TaxID=1101192 RepID=UPI000368B59A|nr:hypothetical protein [Methylobacterium sp. 77]